MDWYIVSMKKQIKCWTLVVEKCEDEDNSKNSYKHMGSVSEEKLQLLKKTNPIWLIGAHTSDSKAI